MCFREQCDQMYFRDLCDRVHFAIGVTRCTFTIGVKKMYFCIHLVTQSSRFAMTLIGGIVVLLLLLLFRSLPRVPTGTISSGPVQDTKNLKICPGREQSGPQNRQIPFTQNQTPTHTTGLKIGFFPMLKDREPIDKFKTCNISGTA